MSDNSAYVIVGASLAGAKAAQALREEGFDGPLILIGEESERPYERPPLSKGYLMGKDAREQIYVHPPQWYAEHDIDLRLGTAVTALDPAPREVTLADGSRLGYAELLLATGSSPRRLPGTCRSPEPRLTAQGRWAPVAGNPRNGRQRPPPEGTRDRVPAVPRRALPDDAEAHPGHAQDGMMDT
jgi:NADPH-dependent 2,4-dienoyl-CoA reductase/sulfur reductase-like enzyme